ncbi:MAG: hypothetical protein ACI4XP_00275, partial [Acutalibacteraceae bacterium]
LNCHGLFYLCSVFKAFVALWGTSKKEVPHEKVSVYAAFSDFGALGHFKAYFFIYIIYYFYFFLYKKLRRSAPYLYLLFKNPSIYAALEYISI